MSLGCYYTAVYYGRVGVLLPTPVALTAPFLYYLSAQGVDDTRVQTLLWEAAFLLCGAVWAVALWGFGRIASAPVPWAPLFFRLSLAGLPLQAPLSWMVWLFGSTPDGWSGEQFLHVCLREAWVGATPWMHAAYLLCAALALAWEIHVLRALFRPGAGRVALFAAGVLTLSLLLAGPVLHAAASRITLPGESRPIIPGPRSRPAKPSTPFR